MKIHLWSVGKAHETYVKQGVELFTKRISHYYPVEWKIFPVAKNTDLADLNSIKKSESAPILSALNQDDVLIVLDERGMTWSSVELADFIQQRANESARNIIFLIGGAYGVHESIIKRSQYIWSLSKLVFPHQLVRLILSEQIYRACTIIRNEKYHHT
ncbi:MAG: 23S rRNA (pseudouridine(1915)-N(3))-methyltransferase RlmH [Ginsengibacter sp.]|jgi:23S rRNA (pseudouridine1915-N3)-methyltransferase